jgi:glucose/mannose-6-phosphate isomerase
VLDSPETYTRLDPTGLRNRILALPEQIAEAWAAAESLALPDAFASIERVAVLGMGGSGIGGSLLRALAIDLGAKTPVDVVRGYTLPAAIDDRTLAIASSNSGNTEEVVALAEAAVDRGARCLAITTGGSLLDLARKHRMPALEYAWTAEPRAALGWSFATLVALCGRLRLIADLTPQLPVALDHMRALATACSVDASESSNPAKQLARRMHGKLPVIVGAEALAPVAYRWRTQLNENAKSWAVAEELPEMNHNGPVGYVGPPALVPMLHTVLLQHAAANPRVHRRIALTREQMSAAGIGVEVIDVPGATVFEQMLCAIQLGDFASYYLGILNEADPSEVRALDWLKKKMSDR